jgi:hypothetical protein
LPRIRPARSEEVVRAGDRASILFEADAAISYNVKFI